MVNSFYSLSAMLTWPAAYSTWSPTTSVTLSPFTQCSTKSKISTLEGFSSGIQFQSQEPIKYFTKFCKCILQAPPGEPAHNFICSQLLEQGGGQSQFPETRGLFGSDWCLPQGLSVGSDSGAKRRQLLVDWKSLWIKLIIPIFWAGIEHFGMTKFPPKPSIVMG